MINQILINTAIVIANAISTILLIAMLATQQPVVVDCTTDTDCAIKNPHINY